MQNTQKIQFGKLSKLKKLYDIREILTENDKELNILFKEPLKELDKFKIIDVEKEMALEHLRALTTKLQTRRLREKIKSSSRYFTI